MKLVEGEAIQRKEHLGNQFPKRRLFEEDTLAAVIEVFEKSWRNDQDFGFQSEFEDLYTKSFCEFLGGTGYADAVSSGTAGLYISLAALELGDKVEVIVPPVTDPGAISAVILNQLSPVVADSEENSFNMSPSDFEKKITPQTKAVMVAHIGGEPAKIEEICTIAKRFNIRVIEDCSQAHGAYVHHKKVGTYGDIAVFSTMFSKSHASGGCGGLVYTEDEEYYWRIRAHADRGKAFNREDFHPKDPSQLLFPALNFNLDELSCAIGIQSLKKLPDIILKRKDFIQKLKENLVSKSRCCRGADYSEGSSPFFYTIKIMEEEALKRKAEFLKAISDAGVPMNPHYRFLVCEWPWASQYLQEDFLSKNAIRYREHTFNLLFHERFSFEQAEDIAEIIQNTEKHLSL